MRSLSISSSTRSSTVTSDAPRALKTPNVVATRPFRRVKERCSPTSSRTSAISSSRTFVPLVRRICVLARSKAVEAEPSTRIACSPPPTCARPPGALRLSERSCWFTSVAVIPSACIRAGSRLTRISRVKPPPRDACATPGSASNRLLTVLSTYQLSCSGERSVVTTA